MTSTSEEVKYLQDLCQNIRKKEQSVSIANRSISQSYEIFAYKKAIFWEMVEVCVSLRPDASKLPDIYRSTLGALTSDVS